ncbi:MAG TPA: hypothetical protein VGL39_24830 [Jatrophihabitantaceae bacterium]|jgi:hypothetical protein
MTRSDHAEVIGVGDVRLVRTFRVGADGGLYPVNSATAWHDGWNTARCGRGHNHDVPDPNCRCGFYAYAHPSYVLAQAPARQLVAVVAVHGALETGTRGARAARARIEGLWLGPRVTEELAARVQARYPAVRTYRDRAAMFAALPLDTLPGFRAPRISERGRTAFRLALAVLLLVVAVVGSLPTSTTLASQPAAAVWSTVLAGSIAVTLGGILARSSMITFVGMTAVAWMATGESTTTLGGVLYRILLLVVAWRVGMVWLRATQPGRVVRDAKLDAAIRRWRGRLPGSP